MDLATILIWTLRTILPIILFYVYFRLQNEGQQQNSGPSGREYSRSEILSQRRFRSTHPIPPALENLCVKTYSETPGPPAPGGRRAPGNRRDSGLRERKSRRNDGGKATAEGNRTRSGSTLTATSEKVVRSSSPEEGVDSTQSRMYLESLVNYVAFNSLEQQRNFVIVGKPPPPPKDSSAPKNTTDASPLLQDDAASDSIKNEIGSEKQTTVLTEKEVEKANEEAQMVLQGALLLKRSNVAKLLNAQLVEKNVCIYQETYTLMVEAAVLNDDLKTASDLLMKMEKDGCNPESGLLDKVMDLYAQQKPKRQTENKSRDLAGETMMEATALTGNGVPPPRAKLSSAARVFVPSFGIPPPPAAPRPNATKGSSAVKEETMLVNSVLEAISNTADPTIPMPDKRAKLVATATPFEPLINFAFDPYACAWDGMELYR